MQPRPSMQLTLSAIAIAMSVTASTALAQTGRSPILPNGTPTGEVPGLGTVDVEEQLGEPIPLDVTLTNHKGEQVQLRDFFEAGKPVMLVFAYHSCPALCSLVLDAAEQGIHSQDWTAGKEFQAITISIDPNDTPERAAAKREEMLEKYDRPGAEWEFLVAEQDVITALTDAAGYRYFYNRGQEQYAHPAAVMFLTPEGEMARYLYGLRLEHNDVRFALLEASQGRSVSTTERFLLYCYAYDPHLQGYTLVAKNVMKLGGALTIVVLGGFLLFFWRRERRRGGFLSKKADAKQPNDPSDDANSASVEQAKA